MGKRALVAGAGGFIGHHLVAYLKGQGTWVRGVDVKEPEYAASAADEFEVLDLRRREDAMRATAGVSEVYHLAADMGGIGYITAYHATVARDNVLIDAHMLEAAQANGAESLFYASSACVYPMYKQGTPHLEPLRESDAWPADPEEGYGLEKLYMEKMCEYASAEGLLRTTVARFHNVYGPLGSYEGGREKAPAAICRKVALAADGGEIEVWGDGEQTRSFMYVDDCVEGIHRIMATGDPRPLNLGTDEMVTVNELVDLAAKIADKDLTKRHDTSKPQGVRGRNSDNTELRARLGWEPRTSLEDGLRPTYRWIEGELRTAGRLT